jgi:hypothetical protein
VTNASAMARRFFLAVRQAKASPLPT